MHGTVGGITAAVTINQALGYIHSLPINSPLYLSLQSQDIKWPNADSADTAHTGWWLL